LERLNQVWNHFGKKIKEKHRFKEQRTRGVIAASAGNHALALSYHGSLLGKLFK
jgi:threonine dehydratase